MRILRRTLGLLMALSLTVAVTTGGARAEGGGGAVDATATPPNPPNETPVPAETGSGEGDYHDRIIAGSRLQPLSAEENVDAAFDVRGLPRSVQIEGFVSRTVNGSQRIDEQGLRVDGFWDTARWGGFSLEANVFRVGCGHRMALDGLGSPFVRCGVGGSATLWQRGLHLNGGWTLENGVGVLNTPLVPLVRSSYRFLLPSTPIAGVSTEWRREDGVMFQGAIGQAGLSNGTHATGFEGTGGRVETFGAQWPWTAHWTGAVELLGTQGLVGHGPAAPATTSTAGGTQAVYVGTAWQDGGDRVQINLLGSRDGTGGYLDGHGSAVGAVGAWVDATLTRGRTVSHLGAYRLDPGLTWGGQPINRDVEGGYYHFDYRYGRWAWSAGLDGLRSLSGHGFEGFYGTSLVRYQASSTLGYGGGINLLEPTRDGHSRYSAQGFLDRSTRWGLTRVQIDRAGGDGASWQVGIDQSLPLGNRARLSASAAYGSLHNTGGLGASQTMTLGLTGGTDLTDRLSLDGTVRWLQGSGPGAQRTLDVNLDASWRWSRAWSMHASVYDHQGSQRSPFVLDPLTNQLPFVALPPDRSVFLTLRYERSAGQPQGVIGGVPGGPSGEITGTVFLDENGDGVRNADELAASHITVVLDQRYSVQTDEQGRFAFEPVAAGQHTLTVVPDNLPLPWFLETSAMTRSVSVGVRDNTRIEIGAKRRR